MKSFTQKAPNRLIPRRLVSNIAEFIYKTRFSCLLIGPYIRRYGVNMDEYVRPIEKYESLVDFFCREIKPELRPIAPEKHLLVSPVDGRIAEYGVIENSQLIQAKGISYSPAGLLGSSEEAQRFEGGLYITIYLSPANYHRIHSPASGNVVRATYIPGTRWPVNQSGVQGIDRLFEKNERIISYLDTNLFGQLAIVKVGAYIIGKICVNYDKHIGKPGPRATTSMNFTVDKGDELGRFEFGSTVIILIEPGQYRWLEGVRQGNTVKMGQPIFERT